MKELTAIKVTNKIASDHVLVKRVQGQRAQSREFDKINKTKQSSSSTNIIPTIYNKPIQNADTVVQYMNLRDVQQLERAAKM